jgi:hypothetical protein
MPYLSTYRLSYQDDYDSQIIIVDIHDTESFAETGDPVITELQGGEVPFRVTTVDNDRTKFKAIRAKAAEIVFKSSDSYANALTFAAGSDSRWLVQAYIESTGFTLFYGYLITDDGQQAFLPHTHKNDIVLTATDNLGTLDEIPLTDFDGNYVRGKKTRLEWLTYALRPTNLELNIVITDTWMEESQVDFECPWLHTYLDGKTFESKIGEAVSCLEALEILLGWNCELKQFDKKWIVSHIDELTNSPAYCFEFTPDGTHVSDYTQSFQKTIGKAQNIKLIGKDAIVYFSRPQKFNRLTFNYNLPIEIIDNIDFSRGTDDIVPIVVDMTPHILTYANLGAFPATGSYDVFYRATDTSFVYKWISGGYVQITGAEIPYGTAFVWEDWTMGRIGGSPTTTGYIAKIFTNGAETSRYAVMPGGDGSNYISCNPIPLNRFDKFTFSFDRRLINDYNNGGPSDKTTEDVAQIRLYGTNGTYWTLANFAVGDILPGTWVECNSAFTTNQQNLRAQYVQDQTDLRQWMNISVDAQPLPVEGTVVILLHQNRIFVNEESHFSNLQFDLAMFINGSYQKYTGHSNTVEQDGDFKANIDEEVRLGDAPHPLIKGGFFINDSGTYRRSGRWYAAGDLLNQSITPPIPDEYLHPFGHLQIYAVWNQNRRHFMSISGSLKGMELTTEPADTIHLYQIEAPNPEIDVENKYFMLTGRDADPESQQWSGNLIEVFDEDELKTYDDPHTFKYEQR